MGKSNCGELEILKPAYYISAFQNEMSVLPPRITTRESLHVQARYEICLFFSSTALVIKELCSVFMTRESLRFPMPMFQLGASSQSLYKIDEKTNVCTEDDEYSDSNIFG